MWLPFLRSICNLIVIQHLIQNSDSVLCENYLTAIHF